VIPAERFPSGTPAADEIPRCSAIGATVLTVIATLAQLPSAAVGAGGAGRVHRAYEIRLGPAP
jgi:hypothetical protein